MRIVALEEHFAVPRWCGRIDPDAIAAGTAFHRVSQAISASNCPISTRSASPRWMRPASPCMCCPPPVPAPICLTVPMALRSRAISTTCWGRPSPRIPIASPAFAHLPTRSPHKRADELERAVRDLGFCGALINGLTEGRFLDDPRSIQSWRGPSSSTCRFICIRICRRKPSVMPITAACRGSRAFVCRRPPGVGTPRWRFTCCGLSCPARSTGTPSSS